MNINELENFSIDELSHLSIEELELEAKELVKKLSDDNRELPFSAVEKLRKLCAPVPETAAKVKKGITIAEACTIITTFISCIKAIRELSTSEHPLIEGIIAFLSDLAG